MGYGALNRKDIEVLESALVFYAGRSLDFLEIGIHVGSTARGLKEWADAHDCRLDYWGIDPVAPEVNPPFPGAHFVQGLSDEVFGHVPNEFDVVFIDGCHCFNHVILDTLHYGSRVRPEGFLLYHDTYPAIQHTMKDPHGPFVPWFFNSVNDALERLSWWFEGRWYKYGEAWEEGAPWGGMRAYRRV